MTAESTTVAQKWGRLRTAVRSVAAAINSEPKHLGSLKPFTEGAVKLLSGKPSSEALDEVEYLLQRVETFVAKWRPSPDPSPGYFYVPPQWAETTDNEAQEALRLAKAIRSAGFDVFDDNPVEGAMKIFVSHSSADKRIAEAFVDLLRAALPLSAKDIRCTSVDGYKLAAGTNSDEQLRQEVFEAQAFLALLSPTSIQSIYVMFELGARWGAKRYLAPVMVAGLTPSALKAPLSAIHAVTGTSEGDLHQLIDTLSERLDVEAEKPAAYAKAMKAFVTASRATYRQESEQKQRDSLAPHGQRLEDLREKILSIVSQNERQHDAKIAELAGVSKQIATFHLHELRDAQLVRSDFGLDDKSYQVDVWFIEQPGRKYLLERGLL